VKRKWMILPALLIALMLTGCSFRTVDQLYCLPKRSQAYAELEQQIEKAMVDRTYCAPRAGENQQTVQMADIDGDGQMEYLVFCMDPDTMLRILVFDTKEGGYYLSDTIEGRGYAFDRVEYVQMDETPGLELIVGRQISDQVLRAVSVYSFTEGTARQILSAGYTRFLTCDLDSDDRKELMILRPGQLDTDNGIAELYRVNGGMMERSNEAPMSGPADKLKRIAIGGLHGGQNAVYVGTTVEESAIITDVYAWIQGQLVNVSLSHESGTSVQTLRNYYVYADDIDADGEVELPNLITMKPLKDRDPAERQYLIRWYAMTTEGMEADKLYTYHNYLGGWYLRLPEEWAPRISVVAEGTGCEFYLWDSDFQNPQKIFTILELTGHDREEQSVMDNRFVLHRSESTIYAAHLEVASGSVPIAMDDLIINFDLIRQDWNTGEM